MGGCVLRADKVDSEAKSEMAAETLIWMCGESFLPTLLIKKTCHGMEPEQTHVIDSSPKI